MQKQHTKLFFEHQRYTKNPYRKIFFKKKNTLLTITVITSNRGFNNCYNTAWSVVIYFST